ncbi:MotA/TolQ/ExbB proton channel family protein [Vibrio parahaemolyticus]|uniref:MotA/TolQ/ExbB proton channel family protein n=1 Tax=Vibrio parahaemolyticus TaxID=670 RepID=UPI00111E8CF5|nr:MotA/TolQ/ExbB proton channel family protein [Vibrio parahaemolyticus]TOG86223.1 hypothetical protein CGI92_24980 [Vibrio parahaemolyticus]
MLDVIDVILKFIKQGGFFMFPIAFVGAIGVAIVLERFISLSIFNFGLSRAEKRNSSPDGNIVDKFDYILNSSSLLRSTFSEAYKLYTEGQLTTEFLEDSVNVRLIAVTRRLTQRVTIISTLANTATLLGLLGTIMGLIQSFSSVATASGAERSALLSSSVSVAMNTTAFGLMIAIPLLLMYVFIDDYSEKSKEHLLISSADIINAIRRC